MNLLKSTVWKVYITRRIENRCSRTWIFHTVLHCWKGSVYCLLQKVCIDFGQLYPCLRSWKCNNIHSNQLQTVVRKNSFKNWCIIGARQWSFQSCLSFCSEVGGGPLPLLHWTSPYRETPHSTPPHPSGLVQTSHCEGRAVDKRRFTSYSKDFLFSLCSHFRILISV